MLPDIPPRYGELPECNDPKCIHETTHVPKHVPKREPGHTKKQEGMPIRKGRGFPDTGPVRRRQ